MCLSLDTYLPHNKLSVGPDYLRECAVLRFRTLRMFFCSRSFVIAFFTPSKNDRWAVGQRRPIFDPTIPSLGSVSFSLHLKKQHLRAESMVLLLQLGQKNISCLRVHINECQETFECVRKTVFMLAAVQSLPHLKAVRLEVLWEHEAPWLLQLLRDFLPTSISELSGANRCEMVAWLEVLLRASGADRQLGALERRLRPEVRRLDEELRPKLAEMRAAERLRRQVGESASDEQRAELERFGCTRMTKRQLRLPTAFTVGPVGAVSFLDNKIVSPRAFVAELLKFRALGADVLDGRAFLLSVLSPSFLLTRVLAPSAFRFKVLSPTTAYALTLAPEAFIARILSPTTASVRTLSPDFATLAILNPQTAVARIASPSALSLKILSPSILYFSAWSKSEMSVEILSPEILSFDATEEKKMDDHHFGLF
ncbi:hypothetical protein M3Y99_00601400 [Aphelenchoides fujianensis]|nr:hypothetical protein M3Y99_00601400 [Aphelenchoides fujianensis]